ncbi:CD44 antigen isoform X2 [Triplophysa rosa]|uniref:CD44 antigen isoform X2 n=1 Tax=Triplophysa rosa TaxID=992332 RepID=UPI00254612DF|nr:CD44 antigen isoform X2 [Triplophysa rosa]
MWIMFLAAIFGFLSSSRSENLTVGSRSCSYVGVFHVEGRQRYSLTFEEAKSLCKHLSASLAQMEEVKKAYDAGLQTCRYGWINDRRTAILRHKPHKSCAGNLVGIRFLERNYSDAFCYDAKDLSAKNCTALSGIYLSGPEKSDGDPGLASAALESSTEIYWTNDGSASVNASQSSTKDNETDQTYRENSDHGNSTSDITRLKDTAALESSTEVYWTNGASASVDESSTKNNESYQTGRENSDWLVILLAILAVLVILLLCVVAATRKSCCGRKQTLVITKVSSAEGNGTSASFTQHQETIKLMNTEKVPASNSEVVDISLNE